MAEHFRFGGIKNVTLADAPKFVRAFSEIADAMLWGGLDLMNQRSLRERLHNEFDGTVPLSELVAP